MKSHDCNSLTPVFYTSLFPENDCQEHENNLFSLAMTRFISFSKNRARHFTRGCLGRNPCLPPLEIRLAKKGGSFNNSNSMPPSWLARWANSCSTTLPISVWQADKFLQTLSCRKHSPGRKYRCQRDNHVTFIVAYWDLL